MRNTLVSVACLVTTLLSAQDGSPNAASSQQRTAWSRFIADHGAQWHAQWNPATGTPAAIFGPGLDLSSGPITTKDAARQHSLVLLQRYADLLGTGGSEFRETIGEKANRLYIFVYQQYFRGLEVMSGRADTRIHDTGALAMMGSFAVQVPASFSTVPGVDSDVARAVAVRELGLASKVATGPMVAAPATRLVIWADAHGEQATLPQLAWEVSIHQMADRKIGRAYVDAQTAKYITYRSDLHECGLANCNYQPGSTSDANSRRELAHQLRAVANGAPLVVSGTVSMWANPTNGPNDPLQNVAAAGIRVELASNSAVFTLTDASGNFSLAAATHPTQLRVRFNNGEYVGTWNPAQGTALNLLFNTTGDTGNAIQIYTNAATQFDRAQSTAYLHTDDVNRFVRSIIPAGSQGPMAPLNTIGVTINSPSSCNAFYTNFSMTFFHAAGGCVNTAYNSVVDHEWGHGLDDAYGNLFPQLQEGVADAVAMLRHDTPIVGQDFFGVGQHVRTGLNTRTWPPTGGVHQQGETWMGFMWDCRLNFGATLGSGPGLALARNLFINCFIADPVDQQNAALNIFLLDDNDANLGNGTPHCGDIVRACLSRLMPIPPALLCPGGPVQGLYTPYGSGCPGTATIPSGTGVTMPAIARTAMGSSANYFPFGFSGMRYQQFFLGSEMPASNAYTGIGVRQSSTTGGLPGGTQTYEIKLGYTTLSAATMNSSFALNYDSGAPMTVLSTQPVNMPSQPPSNTNPDNFLVAIPFTTPFPYVGGRNVIIEWVNTSPTPLIQYWDAVSGAASTTRRMWATSATGTTGTFDPGTIANYGVVMRFLQPGGPGAIPQLSSMGVPVINRSFDLNLNLARASTPTTLFFGSSRTSWGPLPLPFNLNVIGANNCFIRASGDIALPGPSNASGSRTVTVNVPNDASLVGQNFYNQFVVIDPGANPAGVVTTNGGEGRIGR